MYTLLLAFHLQLKSYLSLLPTDLILNFSSFERKCFELNIYLSLLLWGVWLWARCDPETICGFGDLRVFCRSSLSVPPSASELWSCCDGHMDCVFGN